MTEPKNSSSQHTLSSHEYQRFRQVLQSHRLEELEPHLSPWLERSLGLTPTEPDQYLVPGQSRMGGKPDLPSDWQWPRLDDSGDLETAPNPPLRFALQLNLAELHSPHPLLPSSGLLYFFVDDDELFPTGQVLFYQGDLASLRPREEPEETGFLHPDTYLQPRKRPWRGYRLRIQTGLDFPPAHHRLLQQALSQCRDGVGLSKNDLFHYREARHELSAGPHQIFGYPDFRHLDPRDMEQIDLHGPGPGLPLLTLNSDPAVRCSFQEGGKLSLVIDRQKLVAQDFSQVSAHLEPLL